MITEINYKPNLSIVDNYVYSYKTKVAKIEGNKLICLDWNVNGMTTSPTTTKHINYVAEEFNLKITNLKTINK